MPEDTVVYGQGCEIVDEDPDDLLTDSSGAVDRDCRLPRAHTHKPSILDGPNLGDDLIEQPKIRPFEFIGG